MASYENFYTGSAYPFEKPYGGFAGPKGYHQSVKDVAYPTDPLTANQLKKVSDKLSTGARNIEVSGLGLMGGSPMKHLASIPRQHWKEIDRLRKLTGVDLTFHGPLVEATGVGRGNWSEDQREEAERQMKAAVELAQQMNSDDKTKGIVMTFHSSNGLPEVERRIKKGIKPDGSPDEDVVQIAVINERSGQIGNIPVPKTDYLEGKKVLTAYDRLKELNKNQWTGELQNIAITNNRASVEIAQALQADKRISEELKENKNYFKGALELYNLSRTKPQEYEKALESMRKIDPQIARAFDQGFVSNLSDASAYTEDTYLKMKEMYNLAYETALKRDDKNVINQLDKYANELKPVFKEYKGDKETGIEENPSKIIEIQEKINKGIRILEGIKEPEFYRPLKDWGMEKASETFSNVALHAFTNAKQQGLAPGIISIENPPAGMSGFTRADEIAELVRESRKKFVEKAVAEKIMSEKDARAKAEQIIGATWDVGHINSIRKWGFTKADVLREAKTIAPYVKHMHLADNLGFEDAELPIGMGNVPVDEILTAEWGENFRKAKKAVETGDWFSRQGGMGMTATPVRESLSGLSAPVYSMGAAQNAAYWNQAVNAYGGYFSGLGPINPEIHHSVYGGGFGGLPAYLGGEMPGKGNSSFSGTPME